MEIEYGVDIIFGREKMIPEDLSECMSEPCRYVGDEGPHTERADLRALK